MRFAILCLLSGPVLFCTRAGGQAAKPDGIEASPRVQPGLHVPERANGALPPVLISPPQGRYDQPVEVTLKETVAGAAIHYTLDGSLPTGADPVYEKPLKLSGPTILRAKAFKPGFTKSITVQQVFVIGD